MSKNGFSMKKANDEFGRLFIILKKPYEYGEL